MSDQQTSKQQDLPTLFSHVYENCMSIMLIYTLEHMGISFDKKAGMGNEKRRKKELKILMSHTSATRVLLSLELLFHKILFNM